MMDNDGLRSNDREITNSCINNGVAIQQVLFEHIHITRAQRLASSVEMLADA